MNERRIAVAGCGRIEDAFFLAFVTFGKTFHGMTIAQIACCFFLTFQNNASQVDRNNTFLCGVLRHCGFPSRVRVRLSPTRKFAGCFFPRGSTKLFASHLSTQTRLDEEPAPIHSSLFFIISLLSECQESRLLFASPFGRNPPPSVAFTVS